MKKNYSTEYLNSLIDALEAQHTLTEKEYEILIDNFDNIELVEYSRNIASRLRNEVYGNDVYIRGLLEISNYCKCDCFYCGIRRSNKKCDRYRITDEQILDCCRSGYQLGFRTFVLQGGEDAYFTTDKVCKIVREIKTECPDCAVTLSLGERDRSDYEAFYNAGADRYLLRHETADCKHYSILHPKAQTFQSRMQCLRDLKEIGYQVGCGFMVGSPYQTNAILAKDLKFIEEFKPDMCGIGPFIPHHATPFAEFHQGSAKKTIFLLSLIRIIKPDILLPATTALGTIDDKGREKAILAGANVIMPNLSPTSERKKYELYNNKLCTNDEAAENLAALKERINKINYRIVISRGDIKNKEK